MELDLLERLNAQGGSELDWVSFTFIIVTAVVFGVLLKLLYSVYFRENEAQDYSLARSLILLVPSLTATFWMVQSSLVLSLGLLGTLSFVRFRTPVKRAEDVAFIVIALAVSVAIAIGAIPIAMVLVSSLFIFTLIRNAPIALIQRSSKIAVITFNTKQNVQSAQVITALTSIDIKTQFVSARSFDGVTSYVFNASRVSDKNRDKIAEKLKDIDSDSQINVFFPDSRFGT